ncbi:MAG TPA: hypothetical protein VJB59_16140 [Bdellovibrionota bacterium]|nr:hypothetical protein [Bdellovibrionota bacterium]
MKPHLTLLLTLLLTLFFAFPSFAAATIPSTFPDLLGEGKIQVIFEKPVLLLPFTRDMTIAGPTINRKGIRTQCWLSYDEYPNPREIRAGQAFRITKYNGTGTFVLRENLAIACNSYHSKDNGGCSADGEVCWGPSPVETPLEDLPALLKPYLRFEEFRPGPVEPFPIRSLGGGDESDAWTWCEQNCRPDNRSRFDSEECWGCFYETGMHCEWAESYPVGVYDLSFPLQSGVKTCPGNGSLTKCDKQEDPSGDQCYRNTKTWAVEMIGNTSFNSGTLTKTLHGIARSPYAPEARITLELLRAPTGDAAYAGLRNYEADIQIDSANRREGFRGICSLQYRVR